MKLKKIFHFDYWLIFIITALIIFGILVLASVSAIFSQEKFDRTTYYLFHQLIYGLLPGIILGFGAFLIPLSYFKKLAWIFVSLNLLFMLLVFIPGLGIVSGGASRWIKLGPVSFQPSEFLKVNFILYLSAWLAAGIERRSFKKTKKNWQFTLLPFLIIIGIITFLLTLQSDISTLGVVVFVGALMYFSAATPIWHTFLVFSLGVASLFLLIKFAPYRMQRILVFLRPGTDPMGMGYQIKQALITIGSGGILGLGLGMSNQKFGGFLPQPMADSIFAIFAEETGFVGSFALISLFLLFLWKGFQISKKSQDRFSKLFAIGISSWICIQAFINIGSMIGILPLTGIPLPFISYGGSHLVAELFGVGILLNISRSTKK